MISDEHGYAGYKHITYLLYSNEIWANQRNVVDLSEHSNNTAVINPRNEDSEEVRQKCGLFLEVESKGFVVTVMKG